MGPIPISSTLAALFEAYDCVGHFFGGLVAGEGTFAVSKAGRTSDGEERRKFVFQVAMASRDRALLDALRTLLQFGCVNDFPPAKAHWQPLSVLMINSIKAHRAMVIPFFDRYLPRESNKWTQFTSWRAALDAWDAIHPSVRTKGTCSEPGCGRPIRGRGLCRRHYYRVTGY